MNAEAYQIDNVWIGDLRLARYVVNPDLPRECPTAVFQGTLVHLIECRMSGETVAAGGILAFDFTWETLTRFPRDYKIFVQVLNADGVLVAQRDSHPRGGSDQTTAWGSRQPISDHNAILLPADLPPGTYTVIMGWYDASDPMSRLAVDETAADYHTLGTITVESTE